MKIIKYHALDSTKSINSVTISPNEQYIAFGDSAPQITIFDFQSLMRFYKSKPSSSDSPPTSLTSDINCYNISTISIPKLILEHHTDLISSLQFSNTHNTEFSILFSGSHDKSIIIWKISPSKFTGEKIRLIQFKSEISSFMLYPNDQYLIVGCFDHSISITKCNYISNSFENVATFNQHDNIINSIVLDPFIEQTGRFASLSDKGRLIITSFNSNTNQINIIHDYEEFINNSHKCSILQKQIDWSVDGKWIVSVDYHQIKRYNVLHARLININDLTNSQILIGHESPVLTAKFSKCLYYEKGNVSGEEFQICATSDRNGNLIIWKVLKESFEVLVEVNNYSESNITSMIWSYNGEYLITVNSSGSVCAIELNEFNIKIVNKLNKDNNITQQVISNVMNQQQTKSTSKKVIVPTLISQPNFFETSTSNDNINQYTHSNCNYVMNNQPCLKCQQRLYQLPEQQINEVIIPNLFTRDKGRILLSYENQPYENHCIIKLKYGSSPNSNITNILYQSKHLNKMIKLFTSNNFFYAFYDTNFTLNVYTLLNTLLISRMYIEEITLITSYAQYLLILTSQNRMIILDVFTKSKILDEYLHLNSSPNNIFQTKIDEIYFLNLNNIIIKADTVNPYKNKNDKMILFFDSRNSNLILSNNSYLSNEEINSHLQLNNNKEISYYNSYFEKNIYFKEGDKTLKDSDYYKLSSNVDNIYEAIMKGKYFNNKNECLHNYKALLQLINDHPKQEMFAYILDDFSYLFNNDEDKDKIEKLYKEIRINKKQKEQLHVNMQIEINRQQQIQNFVQMQHNVITQPLQQQSITQALIPDRHSIKQCTYDIIESQNMFENGSNQQNEENCPMNNNNQMDVENERENIERGNIQNEQDILNVNIPESGIANDKIIEDKMHLDDFLRTPQLDDENGKVINVPEVVIEGVVGSRKIEENELQSDNDNRHENERNNSNIDNINQ